MVKISSMRFSAGSKRLGSFTQSFCSRAGLAWGAVAGLGAGACRGSAAGAAVSASDRGRMLSTISWGSFSSRTEMRPRISSPAFSLRKTPPVSSARWKAMSSMLPESSSSWT